MFNLGNKFNIRFFRKKVFCKKLFINSCIICAYFDARNQIHKLYVLCDLRILQITLTHEEFSKY